LRLRIFAALTEDGEREQGLMAETWTVAMADCPPIVTDRRPTFIGQLLPRHYDVVADFVENPLFLLGSPRKQFAEAFPGRLARILQCDKTNAQPAGISIRRMIEVVFRLLFAFDPLVRNQKAELITECENTI
jgi:hypothetical protein